MLRPDWENVKIELMEEIVRAKFTQNKVLVSYRDKHTRRRGKNGQHKNCHK